MSTDTTPETPQAQAAPKTKRTRQPAHIEYAGRIDSFVDRVGGAERKKTLLSDLDTWILHATDDKVKATLTELREQAEQMNKLGQAMSLTLVNLPDGFYKKPSRKAPKKAEVTPFTVGCTLRVKDEYRTASSPYERLGMPYDGLVYLGDRAKFVRVSYTGPDGKEEQSMLPRNNVELMPAG